MHVLHRDKNLLFTYDSLYSATQGQPVSNYIAVAPSDQFSILLPSGTAGFQLWANNSAEYVRWNQDANTVFDQPSTYDRLSGFNVLDPSFSANWVNVTSYQIVTQGANGFFVEAAFRYIRLQGASVSGSSSAALGYLMTNSFFQG